MPLNPYENPQVRVVVETRQDGTEVEWVRWAGRWRVNRMSWPRDVVLGAGPGSSRWVEHLRGMLSDSRDVPPAPMAGPADLPARPGR